MGTLYYVQRFILRKLTRLNILMVMVVLKDDLVRVVRESVLGEVSFGEGLNVRRPLFRVTGASVLPLNHVTVLTGLPGQVAHEVVAHSRNIK